jgi:hypothetical protein
MLHKRFADNTSSTSVATRLRRQRFQLFLDMLGDSPRVSILDIGGRPAYWEMMADGTDLLNRLDITLLNIEDNQPTHQNFTALVGDGRSMPQFADGQFDMVFSNSTIEHVGDFADQQRMADEVRRVGRKYYVQTPNRYFPIEPHFVFPFFQFLPIATRAWLLQRFTLGWMPRQADRAAALHEVRGIRLLSKSEMQRLFPDAHIFEERYAGLVKSFVAHSSPA